MQLTPSGRIFARYARQLLGLLEEARAATVAQPHPERGRVRLAAVTTAGEHVLPRLLASFRAEYPDAELSLEVGNRTTVWDLLEHREVDVAIGGRPPGSGRFVTLATRPNVLVLVSAPSRDEPATPVRSISPATLREQVLLPTVTLGSNGAIRESVQVGLGITLMSRDAVARELDEGSLEEWRCPPAPLRRTWHLVARAGDQLPPTAQLLLSHLADPLNGDGDDRFRLVEGDDLP